jgi:predicted GH43/DUF377 family glycosyl hydrolase
MPHGAVSSIVAPPTYALIRLGVIMRPDPSEPNEAWGVLNPGGVRRGGDYHLFPRLVAAGNYSRVGHCRVCYDDGIPAEVERLGIALAPTEPWERNAVTGGGVEDARVTFLPSLDCYVMTYTAYGPFGPRIGLASSRDLEHWDRLGPASFGYEPHLRTDLNIYPNKDALLFPEAVPDPNGVPSYALIHRPMWDLSHGRPGEGPAVPSGLVEPRPSMWISYAPAECVEEDLRLLTSLSGHRQLAVPEQPWEELKIGGGTPPFRTRDGWLTVYHGVSGKQHPELLFQRQLRYAAGILVLDPEDVSRVTYRSPEPLLEPVLPEERVGIVPNVVFPTAIDIRNDGEVDVYYGMADTRIAAARLRRLDGPASQ